MKSLDDIRAISKIDQAGMRDILTSFPRQCREAFLLGKKFYLPGNLADIKDKVKNIVFCAMGGSAIGAEIMSSYLKKEMRIPIYVNRDYSLPGFIDENCLVILVSYSGNTEETLSAYRQAQEKQAKIVVLSSDGQLANAAKQDGYPVLLVPSGFPPRGALAFLSLPILAVFSQMRLIEDRDKQVDETISVLERLNRDSLGLEVKTELNPAKRLAQRLFNNYCVIYAACQHLQGVVTRWRGQLAENSKMLSSSHLLPEMNHNEIVGWRHPRRLLKNFVAVFLRDKEDHPQIKKRIEISKEILKKEGIAIEEVSSWVEGSCLLARIFSLIYIGDFTSYYLAILNGEDPTAVERIDYLKRRLKECK